ncbi:ATPase [Oceaniovalibus guishaninsula JLT2003]|uniref:ATPase n=1 Tax=Oceaniovalibus guishaninsula JLT2003 TaxID=1231392 RepID=K2HJX6_9RHOB|nr:AAA family ATPase [Oceaniovalibus guishaninsula]EKE43304.1 ATPase [Oceaniovalibus guishaninsula JLT2003]
MASTIEIYTDHFGLRERPFSLVPDPGFLFWGPAHKRAFAILEYGIMTRAPITLITGEIGSGKTTLLHHMLQSLEDDVRIGLIANTQGRERGELLRWVMSSLDQPTRADDSYVDLFEKFQTFLIDEYAQGRRVVLVLDEAQNLNRDSLEELRMLTNINANKDELLQLVLVGQPELRDMVLAPDLRQFAQRVTANFHLTAMDGPTVAAYIGHRLEVAGGSPDIFTPEACALVHERTGGVPRLVNQLCDLSLVYGFLDDATRIGPQIVQQVLDDGVFFGGGVRPEPVRLLNPIARAT